MNISRRDVIAAAALGVAASPTIKSAAKPTKTVAPIAGSVTHRTIDANGIHIHIAEQGEGPLVLLCHGWPEGWYSWRHQLPALAAAGFHAVAPDMRGYGRTTAPPDIADYTLLHLVGDLVALVSALGKSQALVVGHDWGAAVAWHAALLRPDIFPAVVGLSVPFRQRGPAPPMRMLRQAGLHTFYQLYFQDPGVAEAEFERDPKDTVARIIGASTASVPASGSVLVLQPGKGFLDGLPRPEHLPSWLSDADVEHMAGEFAHSGFRGGLNYYRNIDRNWELLAPWIDATIRQPALYIGGTADPVITFAAGKASLDAMSATVPGLKQKLLLEGVGHWIQQERALQVNAALIEFAKGLNPEIESRR